MRYSELSLVLIRLKIDSEPYHLLMRHKKWQDWSFVGGHVEPGEQNDWARAAARECNEELAPLQFGKDFTLLPLLEQPLRWGPVASKSASGEPTIYTAQVFALRFLRSPIECLARLPPSEFRIVRESELVTGRHDPDAITARTLRSVSRSSLAWDAALSSLPLELQSRSA